MFDMRRTATIQKNPGTNVVASISRIFNREQYEQMMNMKEAVAVVLGDVRVYQSETSQSTYNWLARRALQEWGEEASLDEITRDRVQHWVNRRKEEVSASTVRHEVAFLNRCFTAAKNQGHEVISPTRDVRKPRINNFQNRVLMMDEQARLKGVMEAWDFSIVEFALNTGLRRLEVWNIRCSDVQLWKRDYQPEGADKPISLLVGMLTIRRSKTGKGRQVPLNPTAAVIAERWMGRRQPYLFWPDTDIRVNAVRSWANRVWLPALKEAGIEGLTFHKLRHTFATRAIQGGARLEAVSWALGHASLEETRSRYVHWDAQQIWPAVLAVARGGR